MDGERTMWAAFFIAGTERVWVRDTDLWGEVYCPPQLGIAAMMLMMKLGFAYHQLRGEMHNPSIGLKFVTYPSV